MTQVCANNWAGRPQLHISEVGQPARAIALHNAVTIGRDTQNDIVLAAATVSRQHALLLGDDNGTLLIDLDSTNGTLVNGVLARPDEPVRLMDGDMIRFGQVVARYSGHALGRTPAGTRIVPVDARWQGFSIKE
jgi:pSer/pThr/pTyr-binding forkhead associated (FHA) protein